LGSALWHRIAKYRGKDCFCEGETLEAGDIAKTRIREEDVSRFGVIFFQE
jgi:hypothetical protein